MRWNAAKEQTGVLRIAPDGIGYCVLNRDVIGFVSVNGENWKSPLSPDLVDVAYADRGIFVAYDRRVDRVIDATSEVILEVPEGLSLVSIESVTLGKLKCLFILVSMNSSPSVELRCFAFENT